MMTANILVLDVGTSALKALVFDARGTILAVGESDYGDAPAPHRQSVDAWWRAARAAIAELGRPSIDAIALTGTMENLIAVDDGGNAVADAILYTDPCGTAAHQRLGDSLAALAATDILGNPPEPLMTAFKFVWLAEHDTAAAAAARYFLPGAKDALALRLTGLAATDPVTATTTGLMDLGSRTWSRPLVDQFAVPAHKLPEILPADTVIGTLKPAAAVALGIHATAPIPVINGCGDAGATTVGAGCHAAGDLSLYVGTSGWLARVVDDQRRSGPSPQAGAPVYRLAYPEPGRLIEITPILSAGAAAAWARRLLGLSQVAAESVLAEVDHSPADIVFLPYLTGERSPFFDAHVRGGFSGLDASHGPAELYYAVLEGVAFAIRANLEALDPDGSGPIRLAGGGAQSALWPQMLADIVGRPMAVSDSPGHVTAIGAFALAAKALDLPAELSAGAAMVAPRTTRRSRAHRLAGIFAQATAAARRLAGQG